MEGLGFGTETLVGNFKGKGSSQHLVPLAGVSLGMALLVGLSFGGVCWLFPDTVFGLLTNHTEVTSNIDIFVPWLVLVLVCSSISFMLDGYFLGLAQGHTLRNVSLVALAVGFLSADVAAIYFESNHFLWLALSLFLAIKMVMLGVQLPRIFARDVEDGGVSPLPLEESRDLTVAIEENHLQMGREKLEVGSDEKQFIN